MRIGSEEVIDREPLTGEIDVAEFEGCCAIQIASELEMSTPEEGDSLLQAAIKETDHGMLLYAATQEQKEVVAALVRNGFEPVTACFNPNTQNTITLYAKIISPVPVKRARAARPARTRTRRAPRTTR